MTTERAVEVLRLYSQYVNGAEAVQTVLDALAAEERRADEAHAAGFREAVERAAEVAEFRGEHYMARTIRALAPAAPTDAAPAETPAPDPLRVALLRIGELVGVPSGNADEVFARVFDLTKKRPAFDAEAAFVAMRTRFAAAFAKNGDLVGALDAALAAGRRTP